MTKLESTDYPGKHINESAPDGRAAQSTYDALLWELREYGGAQLAKPNTQRRLSELAADQLDELVAALTRLQAKYSQTCTDDLIALLRGK